MIISLITTEGIAQIRQFNDVRDDSLLEISEKYGGIAPRDHGFFGEMSNGFCFSFISTIKFVNDEYFEDVLKSNQNWRQPENLATFSKVGRFIGDDWFITIPCLCLALLLLTRKSKERVKVINEKCITARNQSDSNKIKALEELESGNLDKLAWAKALEYANGDSNKAKSRYIKIRSKK